jgi:DNA topoisomerase VI subunit A
LKYIDNPKYEKTFLELIESEEAFKVATQALTSISTNEQERYNLFARQKAENDYNHDIAMSERIGRQQGREEGVFLKLIESEEAFRVATQALTSISTNEQERYNLFARQKAENDYNHDMAMSEEIGRQQGREEGVLQGLFQTAKRMLNRGKTVSEVVENTGLTEQQIISLKNE